MFTPVKLKLIFWMLTIGFGFLLADKDLLEGFIPVSSKDLTQEFSGSKLIGNNKESASLTGVKDSQLGEAFRLETTVKSEKIYDVSAKLDLEFSAKEGDALLITFWARCPWTADESAMGQVTIQNKASTAKKPMVLKPLDIDKTWKQFCIPFSATENFTKSILQIVIGGKPQKLEIAQFKILNFENKFKVIDLPIHRSSYSGMEAEAAWRKSAKERIEQIRKSDVVLKVTDEMGKPKVGVTVKVSLTNHLFRWGGAIAEKAMWDKMYSEEQRSKYQTEFKRLFNFAVFENGMKWKSYDNMKPLVEQTITWAADNSIALRGHCFIWAHEQRIPKNKVELLKTPELLKTELDDHIRSYANLYPKTFVEWDVLNEPYSQHQFMDILGKEQTVRWFQVAREANPSFSNWINDYAVLEGNDTEHQNSYHEWVKYLIENNAPLDGIGFQGHFRAPIAPEEMIRRLDSFAKYGKPLQITEYDFETTDDQLQAKFTEDLMTVAFSYPLMQGFLTWTVWGKDKEKPQGAFFREDFSERPVVKTWLHLIKEVWTTDLELTTDSQGQCSFRGFKGSYEIKAQQNGREVFLRPTISSNSSFMLSF